MNRNPMHTPQPHARACGAKTRSSEPCRNLPVTGATRCRMHGGATPSGIASPHFRTGRHSKHLPVQLVERYRESLADPELLALRDDIALVDARVADLLMTVSTVESGSAWKRLAALWRDLETAQGKHDASGMARALTELGSVIRGGLADAAAWVDVMSLIEQRRKLTETEHKRLVAMQQMIGVEEAMTFVAAVQASVQRHIRDPVILRAIAGDMAQLAQHKRSYDV